jgi:hypothetical protein
VATSLALQVSASGSAGSGDIGAPISTASIFYSGHSLLDAAIAANVNAIAVNRGFANEYENQMYPGSSIWARTANSTDPDVSPGTPSSWDGWTNGQDKNGATGLNSYLELKNTNRISAVDYSHLIIAENHDSLDALRFSKGLKALRCYYDTFMAAAPSGKVYYYDAWKWIRDPNNLTEWIETTREQCTFWEGIASRINDSLTLAGRSDRMATLPAGAALAYLLERATTSTVAGITQGSVSATLFTVIQDEAYAEGDVHLNAVGAYFMGCVVYAAVYRRSPVGAATVSGVTGTQATSLQNVAWDFISSYYDGKPLGPQHNTAARLSQASTFATTYCTYDDEPGDIDGFQDFFSTPSSANPLYWASGADAPAGGWWPFPT